MGDTRFEVRDVEGRAAIIDIEGEVTPAVEGKFTDAYGKASATDPQAVILNFSGLDYMNSGGIGLLVTLLVRAQRSKQRLMAFGLSDHYRQILELTRLDDAIAIHDDEASALAAV